MLLHDPLLATARRLPDKVAIVDKNGRTTYGQLGEAVERFAAALRARGVAAGDRVAVFLPNAVETVVAMYGALRAGAVFMPVNPQTRADKLAALLVDADATVLVASAPLAAVWEAALARTSCVKLVIVAGGDAPAGAAAPTRVGWAPFLAEGAVGAEGAEAGAPGVAGADLATLIYTSGSTAEPKGVMLSHDNMRAVAAAVTEYLGLEESDVLYCALPLSFSYGICQLTCGLPLGARIVLDSSFAFPAKSLALIAAERATCFAGVPTMYGLLLAQSNLQAFDLGALRLLTNAADALPEPAIAGLRQAFPRARLFSMYGLTECQRASYLPPEELDRRSGSVGRGIPGQRWWLVGDDGQVVPAGQTGELVVAGPHVMRGYWRQPDATAARLRPGPDGQTALFTGDLFRTDDDGFLYFVARKDDVIKTRGEKVSPREVEAAIHTLPDVAAVAVVGVRDALLGQTIKAFVVRRAEATVTGSDVLRRCRERLESYMIPHEVAFVETLPTTLTGKVRRKALTETET